MHAILIIIPQHGAFIGILFPSSHPSMVHSLVFFFHSQSQYEFCYKTTLEYLESFELYDNFK